MSKKHFYIRAGIAAGQLLSGTCAALAGDGSVVRSLDWIDRPWEYRYLLYVELVEPFEKGAKSQDFSSLPSDKGLQLLWMPGPFSPTWLIQWTDKKDNKYVDDTFAVLRIDVKQDRTVTTPNRWGLPLEARLNVREDIVLAPKVAKPEKIVRFAEFFMGTYAASDTRYSPTMCSTLFGDNTDPRELSGRYVDKYFNPISDGYFGCREWAAQLYDPDRHYIDVTSYANAVDFEKPIVKSGPRKGYYPLKKPLRYAPEIKHFIGFSRFEDPPKPVIGNHQGQWLCLNDCPGGETPAKIADIKAWATKYGWPVPQPPKNVREFMDKKVEPGNFMD